MAASDGIDNSGTHAPMGVMPLSLPLNDTVVVIIGGGAEALNKALIIAQGKVILRLVAGQDGAQYITRQLNDRYNFHSAAITQFDDLDEALKGASLVIIAEEDAENWHQRVLTAIKKTGGRPIINVVDRPKLCDVYIPSVIDRGHLVISIATGGVAPVLAARLRVLIEAIVPPYFRALMVKAKEIRANVNAQYKSASDRRAFWNKFLDDYNGPSLLSFGIGQNGPKIGTGQVMAPRIAGAFLNPSDLTLAELSIISRAEAICAPPQIIEALGAFMRRDCPKLPLNIEDFATADNFADWLNGQNIQKNLILFLVEDGSAQARIQRLIDVAKADTESEKS